MNRLCNPIRQKMQLQMLPVISRCALKGSAKTSMTFTSQSVTGWCNICRRCITSSNYIIYEERDANLSLSYVNKWLSVGRSFSLQASLMDELHYIPRPHILSDSSSALNLLNKWHYTPRSHSLSKSSSALNQNVNITRHFSTTTRTFSAAVDVPSAIPLEQTASDVVISSSSSSGLLLPDLFPVYGAERVIDYVHQITGLPWWATIILTAFFLRVVVMAPLTVHTFQNLAKLQNLQPKVKEIAVGLRKEVAVASHQFGWTENRAKQEYRKNFKRLLTELYIKENCHPMKGVAVFWVQMPIWISVSYALRNMSVKALNPTMENHENLKGLTEQGLAWFPDLTAIDVTWLLPVMMGAVTLLNTEMNYLAMPEITRYRKWLTYGMRGIAFFFIPVSATMPSSMVLYWISSGTFAAMQTLLFDYSPFRRLVGLPKSSMENNSPLRVLSQRAKARYWSKK